MIAGDSEWVYESDGMARRPTLHEKLVLTELEGYNLEGLERIHQNRLQGNMVQISFAEHIRTHILNQEDSIQHNHIYKTAA